MRRALGSRLRALHLRHQLAESRRVLHGEIGQLLAVQRDARGLESGDERAVREPVFAGGGVDAHDPQTSEVALLVAAADEGILERSVGRLFRGAIQLALVAEHSFRTAQQLLALLTPDASTLHSWHCGLLKNLSGVRDQEPGASVTDWPQAPGSWPLHISTCKATSCAACRDPARPPRGCRAGCACAWSSCWSGCGA